MACRVETSDATQNTLIQRLAKENKKLELLQGEESERKCALLCRRMANEDQSRTSLEKCLRGMQASTQFNVHITCAAEAFAFDNWKKTK